MQKGLKLFTVSWEQIKRRQKSFWWWYIPTPENSNEYCLKYEMCVLFQTKGWTNRSGIIYPYVSVAFTFEFIGYNSFFYLDIFMAKHTNKLQGLQMYISHLCSQFKYAKKEIKAKQKLLCSYNALILFFIPIIEETISAKMCFAQSQNWDTTKNGNQFLRVYVCIYTSFCTLFHFYILHFFHISFRTHNRIFVCRRFWQTY